MRWEVNCESALGEGVWGAAGEVSPLGKAPPPPRLLPSALRSLADAGGRLATLGLLNDDANAKLHRLEQRASAACAWLEEANAAIRGAGKSAPKSAPALPLSKLLTLVLEGERLTCVRLDELPLLRERAQGADAWLAGASHLVDEACQGTEALAVVGERVVRGLAVLEGRVVPTLAELIRRFDASLHAAKPLLRVAEVAAAAVELGELKSRAHRWLENAVRLFRKPGSQRPLLELLRDNKADEAWPPGEEEMAYSCPCCISGEEIKPISGEEIKPIADAPNTPATPPPTAASELMWLGCDSCNAWFHAPCVGVNDALADSLEHFVCPRCTRQQARVWPFADGSVPALKRTQRPSMSEVRELSAEGAEDPMIRRTAEYAASCELLETSESWVRYALVVARRLAGALQGGEGQQRVVEGGKGEGCSAPTLATVERELEEHLRDAEALEVRPDREVAGRNELLATVTEMNQQSPLNV